MAVHKIVTHLTLLPYCAFITHTALFFRQGSYKLIESDEQFQVMQHHHRRSESEIHQSSTQRENQAPNQQQQRDHTSRKSGYVNSGAETEAEANSQASMKRNRRRQRYLLFL